MKVGIATTLSVAGVLAAGAAAFALNTAVLSDGPGAAAAPVMTAAPVAPATGATTAPTADGQVVAAGDTAVVPDPTKVSDTVTTYKVGEAGSVIIDTASGAIVVTDVVPAAGWTAEPARTEADGAVKVHFMKGSTRLEFTARMANGTVDVKVVNDTPTAPPAPNPGVAPTVPPSLRGDDDDDDEHEEREHHDDDHEEDEDDD